MGIAELLEIALAGTAPDRVEVAALEPAEIAIDAVSNLSQLIAELVDNGLAFSEPGGHVRVTGLFQQQDYLISVSDRGIGLPEGLITELNKVLANPDVTRSAEPGPGIALIARLAARNGIEVRLVPGVPGITARVTVPARLVQSDPGEVSSREPVAGRRLPPREHIGGGMPERASVFSPSLDEMIDLSRFESDAPARTGVVAMSDEAKKQAEAFLDRVFAPLRDQPGTGVERPPTRSANGNGRSTETPGPASRRDREGNVTALRVRVPGENFSMVEDDPSTVAGERAIDIRSALSRYEQGRRSAAAGNES